MKNLCVAGVFAASISLVGCGGSSEPTNVMGNASQSEIQNYDDLVAADEAMMDANPDDGEDEGGAAPAE